MVWLFPFTSTVSFGLGEAPQTFGMPTGPAFHPLQDLMSVSCLKLLKMELLTNWEWCCWFNENYGNRGGTTLAAGQKINRWPLCDTSGLQTFQIKSTYEWEKNNFAHMCVLGRKMHGDRLPKSCDVCEVQWKSRQSREILLPLAVEAPLCQSVESSVSHVHREADYSSLILLIH